MLSRPLDFRPLNKETTCASNHAQRLYYNRHENLNHSTNIYQKIAYSVLMAIARNGRKSMILWRKKIHHLKITSEKTKVEVTSTLRFAVKIENYLDTSGLYLLSSFHSHKELSEFNNWNCVFYRCNSSKLIRCVRLLFVKLENIWMYH